MRGAQYLQCKCGDFFVKKKEEDLYGKLTLIMQCTCGREKHLELDGKEYKITEINGSVIESEEHGIYEGKGRKRLFVTNSPFYYLEKKLLGL